MVTVTRGQDSDAGSEPTDPIEPQACELIEDAVTMVVQPRFRIGDDGSSFALLMVTPSQPEISLERITLFNELAERTRPIVEVDQVTIEDPALGYQCRDAAFNTTEVGCGGGTISRPRPEFDPVDPPGWTDPETDTVEAIGPYEVARLSAITGDELATSLADLGYEVADGDIDAIVPYLDIGYVAIAVRVQVDGALVGGLRPISLTYPGTEMRLPLGLSRQEQPAETHIALYVSAEDRYDFPGATISYAGRQNNDESFLTRATLSAQLNQDLSGDPIAFASPGNDPYQEVVTVTQETRIPSSDCPDGGNDQNDEGFCFCQQGSLRNSGDGILLGLTLFFLWGLSRRRRKHPTPNT